MQPWQQMQPPKFQNNKHRPQGRKGYHNMKSKSTKTAYIDGDLMKVGNPDDHENIKAVSRTTVYYLHTYGDGSAALRYDNGYTDGTWCGVEKLKYHLMHNAYITGKQNLIPEEWTITDESFFKSLNII